MCMVFNIFHIFYNFFVVFKIFSENNNFPQSNVQTFNSSNIHESKNMFLIQHNFIQTYERRPFSKVVFRKYFFFLK